MSRLFARLGSAFVAPPPAAARREQSAPAAPAPAAPTVGVLCRPHDALAIGGATAVALATRCHAPRALLAVWHAPAALRAPRAPARASARRLAATLSARGHDVFASGRLAVVALADDATEAAAEAMRAGAAAGDVPTVTVLAGARDPAADRLLRAQDAILVAVAGETEAAVAELALRGLEPLGVPARAVTIPPGAAHARALAASGVAVVPPLRGAVEPALERLA